MNRSKEETDIRSASVLAHSSESCPQHRVICLLKRSNSLNCQQLGSVAVRPCRACALARNLKSCPIVCRNKKRRDVSTAYTAILENRSTKKARITSGLLIISIIYYFRSIIFLVLVYEPSDSL